MKAIVTKIMFVVMAFALLNSISQQVEAATDGWENGYYYINGKKQKSTWIQDGKNRYYVNSKGKKIVGWKKIGKKYYYFNQTGNLYNSRKPLGVKLTTLSNHVVTMGIDASQFQGHVDWQKVKDAGVHFVMLRVGYGKGRYGAKHMTMDSRFKEYVEKANDAGIAIGIYFYSYATTPERALEEAKYTIEQLDGVPVSFPVAYDIEDDYIVKNTTTEQRTEMVKTFMDTIEAAGYKPMYYCNQNWYNNYLDADALEDYDFWYARYTYVEPDHDEYPYCMWQATSQQKLAGITENTVDVDFLYKNYFEDLQTRTSALKYGWYKEDGFYRYYYQGKPMKSGWISLAGKKYYISNRAASIGWKNIDGKKYYFDKKGIMQTGFVKISGNIYMFDDDGALTLNTTEPGIKIDEDGVCHIKKGWYQDAKGKYFYRNANGSIARNKWLSKKGKKYYVGSNGRRVIGFKTIKKKRYYFNKDGVMQTGWLTYKTYKYYFRKNGQMVTNTTIRIKGKKYSFNGKGWLK